MSTVDPRASLLPQDKPQGRPKKKIKTTKDVNGVPTEIEIEVDDVDGPTWGERKAHTLLNTDLKRVDGPQKLTGRARYTHDVRVPGMVFARLLCAPWPKGTVTIDASAAKALPGVEAVVQLKSEIGYLGDPICAVAARTPELCDDALRALRVELTPAPFVITPERALADDAPKVRKNGNKSDPRTEGDPAKVEAALAACAAVVEAVYTVPVQHHASLETHGVVIDYRGGEEATVYISTQDTFGSVEDAAKALGLKASQVTCIVEHMGGGFGAKFGFGVEGAAACKLAKELKRPVHLMLGRADEFVTAGNRSGARATFKAGIAADGKLAALHARIEQHGGLGGGSYAKPPYIYKVGEVYSERVSVYTHMDANRAMRAPGHPQASFGMEGLIDELSYAAGLDPLEVRKKNVPDAAWVRQLDRIAKEIGWTSHPHRTKPGPNSGGLEVGIGFGISIWPGSGPKGNLVDVRIAPDGSVTATCGTQDLGTGTRTYLAAIVAEELGLPLEGVTARIGSSAYPPATSSGGSTTTAAVAPAAKHGAYLARTAFAKHIAELWKIDPALVRFERGRIVDGSDGKRALDFAKACASLPRDGITARGEWQASLMGNRVHGTQAAKVEVDTLTGLVRVVKMVGIQECGLPMNRAAVRSQLNGGMVQALSYGLLEERVVDPVLGIMLNPSFEEYKIAGSTEIPEMVAIIDDEDERDLAIGMAEGAVTPGQSAIANAVFNACGARVRDLPLTPDKVLAALGRLS